MFRYFSILAVSSLALFATAPVQATEVKIADIGRFDGWEDNALTGYGLVVGLSGSGDSRRNRVTQQALRNAFTRLGLTVSEDDISSRNVAAVFISATLPASANVGDKINVTVSSAGDARSLAGGMLIATPLVAGNSQTYALAQGALTTGGYSFESEGNFQQKNFPTTARLEGGAKIVQPVDVSLIKSDGSLAFLLDEPDFTTADRTAEAINKEFGGSRAYASGADEVLIDYKSGPRQLVSFIRRVNEISVQQDVPARVVINERTGTVVAGADVTISSVVISQGDVRVKVTAETFVSQPNFISGVNPNIASLVVRDTDLDVTEGENDVVATFDNTTIAELVTGLNKAGMNTRGIIDVLQSMKSAGAINADIIVQ